MTVVRVIHAAWSLLVIVYGYKLAKRFGSEKSAWYAGLFLSLAWFMPFISVRNLVEFVCVPLVLISAYRLSNEKLRFSDVLVAGMCMGIAFSVRFQTLFLGAGLGLAMLLQRRSFMQLFLFALSYVAFIVIVQGGIDMVIWHRPFAELQGYVQYNLQNSDQYGHNIWHMYFDLILGLLIPPLSFVLFAGYFYEWKRIKILFWPVLIYLAFHTYFPNKQERFVMTILPLIMIAGTVGMFALYEKYGSRIGVKTLKYSAYFVIILNFILLPILSVAYSKRHRVESMYYLNTQLHSPEFFVDDANNGAYLMPPLYYYGKWIKVKGITNEFNAAQMFDYYQKRPERPKPQYIVFWEARNLDIRIDSVKKYWPQLKHQATIEPSIIDKTIYWLKPENSNETAEIYKLE